MLSNDCKGIERFCANDSVDDLYVHYQIINENGNTSDTETKNRQMQLFDAVGLLMYQQLVMY